MKVNRSCKCKQEWYACWVEEREFVCPVACCYHLVTLVVAGFRHVSCGSKGMATPNHMQLVGPVFPLHVFVSTSPSSGKFIQTKQQHRPASFPVLPTRLRLTSSDALTLTSKNRLRKRSMAESPTDRRREGGVANW